MEPIRQHRALEGFLGALEAEGAARRRAGQERELFLPSGVDFSSNDYLGLSRHPAVLERMRAALESHPAGAGASRLLSGNLPIHAEVESRLATWKGTEAALLFPSGYSANLGVLGALIRREDRALSDGLNHASIIDGLKLTGCRRQVYPHLDLDALEGLLAEPHPVVSTSVVTETLFSMEGDLAPLDLLAGLAERHGALFILDDAHATGLFGERGSGLTEEFSVAGRAAAIVSTCGKALGLWGAFAAGPAQVMDCLINRARSFVFSTAVPPALAAGIDAAVAVVEEGHDLRHRLFERSAHLRAALRARGIEAPAGRGPIVPVILGADERALRAAEAARSRGYDVRAVRAPSVPADTARIRLSVHAGHSSAEIEGVCDALARSIGRLVPGGAALRGGDA